ncbi:MAG: BON domain-containing protein [Pseudomonadota bacterium]
MNDLQLKHAVSDALEFDLAFDASHIGVFVSDRVVTLSGWVDDFAQKHAAAEAVRRVRGVHALAMELEVRYPSDKKFSDDEIAARAAKIIEWDLRLPQGTVAVTVDNGMVELQGEVGWVFMRREAEADVRKLGGVLGVRNHIVVRPHVERTGVQGDMAAARTPQAPYGSHCAVHLDLSGAHAAQPCSSVQRGSFGPDLDAGEGIEAGRMHRPQPPQQFLPPV